VITGAAGAGKTTLIARLLSQRPRGERWGILQNDFGAGTLDLAPGVAGGEVALRRVSGCICCTAHVGLRTALIALVRKARPQRLLIEASALAEPTAAFAVLRDPGIAPAVELRCAACVVSPRQLADARHLGSEVYRKQIEAADVVVLWESRDDERRAVRAALARLIGPRTQILESADVGLSMLDKPAPR
jgi:G3E family GTPase